MLLRNQVKLAYISLFAAKKVEWDLFPRSHFAMACIKPLPERTRCTQPCFPARKGA